MICVAGSGDLVSIVVPVFNGEKFIGRTLDSLLAQTHCNFEIVVVDDGSTDGTSAILEARARDDARIRVFQTDRVGPPRARNHAARQARGDFIAPCDSDDLWHSDKLILQLAALRNASPATGLIYCWSVAINAQDEVILPRWSCHTAEGKVLHEAIADSLTGSGSVPLIRRAFFDRVGGFPEDIYHGDEWQICIALANICEFIVVREYLVAYRLGRRSTSTDYLAVENSLACSTLWISATWPDLPERILKRRAYNVNSYLAFLAARAGNFLGAIKYKARAFRAWPARFWGASLLDFYFLILGEIFGIERYYYRVWRVPKAWSHFLQKSEKTQ